VTIATLRTSASLGASTTALTSSGAVTATATQNATTTTIAKGDTTVGSNAGFGIALALAIVDDAVDSGTARSITAVGGTSAVTFQAFGTSVTTTTAEAAAEGAEGQTSPGANGKDSAGTDVNQKADSKLGAAQQTQGDNSGGRTTSTSSTPKAASNENSGASVSVAAAVAINIVTTGSRAWFGNASNPSVIISSGAVVTLASTADTDAGATARGDTTADASVGIGAGVSVNKVDITNTALTGTATITATGLVLSAGMAPGGAGDVLRVWSATDHAWKTMGSGKQLPGPSDGGLAAAKAKTSSNNAGIYTYDGGTAKWVLQTDAGASIATGASLPASPAAGQLFVLLAPKDAHPTGSVWRWDAGTSAWVFVTKDAFDDFDALPADKVANDTVALLRAEAGRDPYDRDLSNLIGELSTRSEDFRVRWAAHDVRIHNTGIKKLRHPVVGDLDLPFESLPIEASSSTNLVSYLPEPDSPSHEALGLLASWAGGHAEQARTAARQQGPRETPSAAQSGHDL
jgi:hypothetical protein